MPGWPDSSFAVVTEMSTKPIPGEHVPVNKDEVEAVAVAKLIGSDERSVVGWVYRWNNGSLGVLWRNGPKRVVNSSPKLTDAERSEIGFYGLGQSPSSSNGQTKFWRR